MWNARRPSSGYVIVSAVALGAGLLGACGGTSDDSGSAQPGSSTSKARGPSGVGYGPGWGGGSSGGKGTEAGAEEAGVPEGGGQEAGSVYEGGSAGLAIRVSGNQLVDAKNTPIVLRGADVSGTEFVCAQNYTADPYGGAPLGSAATFQAMRAWNINVIRLPLNEDCWLDINGVQIGGQAYTSAIEAEVSAAHAAGLFVILDLHWTAPGTQRALSQNPEPDADHSPAFWSSVAATFASDPGVILDLFNEPYDYWGTDPDPWNGWLNGDVQTQYTTGGTPYTVSAQWHTAGMQQLLTAVRAAGATQPVLINGLDWANDDSGWLAHAPSDPLGQVIVGAHIYPGESCASVTCWSGVFPALSAKYPVLVGETGDNTAAPATFLPIFFGYADAQSWNYLAWTWNPWQDSANVLVTDWSGTPNSGEGAAYQAHLLAVPFQN